MRTFTAAGILVLIFACICPPVAAQGSSPTFLFLLESKGVPTGTIHVFRVNVSTGALTEAPGSPFTAGLIPEYLTVDPTGRFLYVGNQLSQDITAFSINASSGALAELSGSPYAMGSQPGAMSVDPTGRFLYVAGTNAPGQGLFEFTIDGNTGMLTPAPGSPQGGLFATSFAFDPLGNYAYLSTGSPSAGLSSPILVCTINFATGMLRPVGAGQPSSGGASASAIFPGGSLLYSVDAVTSELDAFTVGGNGAVLAESTGSPYSVPHNPASLVVHPAGSFLYVVNQNQSYQTNSSPSQYDGSISVFTINSGSGAITPISGPPISAGINPLSIVVDPTGRFAYATATIYPFGFTGAAQILSFSIDPVSGILTPLPGTPWTDPGPVSNTGMQLAISPGAFTAANPAPTVSSLSPASTNATGTPLTLLVNGTNFVPASTVYFGGQARVTTFVSSSQLSAKILASDIDNGGTAVVFVFNPLPGGGASTSIEFPVFNPVPILTSLSPNSVMAGTSGFSFGANGSNFVTSSVIKFNGTPLITSYLGPTALTTAIPVALIPTQGTANITVTNPANVSTDGGTSNAATMTISAPNTQPVVTSIAPTSAAAGGPAFTLTVNGSGFVQGSQITFHLLNNFTTVFVNSGQLTAVIPASDIAVAGNSYVIVNNPDGFASPPLNFAVTNPPAGIGSVTPPSLPVGSNALTLNVMGTGFLPGTPGVVGSQVLVNGSPRQTTFVSSTLLQATLLPGDLSQAGTLIITVLNPFSAGGTTQPIQVAVTDFSLTLPASVPPITAGQTANIRLTVSPVNGSFPYPVMFSAAPLPLNATATFVPSMTITPGGAAQTVTLSISTMPHAATTIPRVPSGPRPPLLIFGLLGILVVLARFCLWTAAKPPARLAPQLLLALLFLTLAGLAACGAVSAPTSSPAQVTPVMGTSAGNYTIQITATSGAVSHSASVTLTVM